MHKFGAAAGGAMLALLATSCGASVQKAVDPVTQTVTVTPGPASSGSASSGSASSGSASSSSVTSSSTTPRSTLPNQLVGRWQSVDQGSAEDLIEIHADGSYLRAMLMMQQRPSGVFSFSIGSKGRVLVRGSTLRLAPTSGTQSMSDPDAPASNYTDQPLDDYTPDDYRWVVSGGSLWLDGKFGRVEFRPAAP